MMAPSRWPLTSSATDILASSAWCEIRVAERGVGIVVALRKILQIVESNRGSSVRGTVGGLGVRVRAPIRGVVLRPVAVNVLHHVADAVGQSRISPDVVGPVAC